MEKHDAAESGGVGWPVCCSGPRVETTTTQLLHPTEGKKAAGFVVLTYYHDHLPTWPHDLMVVAVTAQRSRVWCHLS